MAYTTELEDIVRKLTACIDEIKKHTSTAAESSNSMAQQVIVAQICALACTTSVAALATVQETAERFLYSNTTIPSLYPLTDGVKHTFTLYRLDEHIMDRVIFTYTIHGDECHIDSMKWIGRGCYGPPDVDDNKLYVAKCYDLKPQFSGLLYNSILVINFRFYPFSAAMYSNHVKTHSTPIGRGVGHV